MQRSYLVQLGPVPEERRASAVARRVARSFERRRPPSRLSPPQSLKALSRRRLGLVRFTRPPRDP